MKKALYLCLLLSSVIMVSFKPEEKCGSERPAETAGNIDSFIVSYKGMSHVIREGDTVHLGYGSGSNDNFIYVWVNGGNGAKEFLDPMYAKAKGTVKKIKYWKMTETHAVLIKGKFGQYLADLPQAVERGEVIGFNSTFFNTESK